MGGGLLQLVAYGAQDVYLTGNPQITFFKVVYRRHTNFAMEAIEQSFNGNPSIGSRVSVLITRNGDLINRIYFRATLKNTAAGGTKLALVPYYGLRLLKNIELEIGGQRIDKHYSEWLYIWNELSMPVGKKTGYDVMVGGNERNASVLLDGGSEVEVYVPLEFWFCRNVGLALPLIALQYHEVKINI
jgi:type IV secretory pathway TrbD component